jgi:tetratricopeptide (TPR) repeat protein
MHTAYLAQHGGPELHPEPIAEAVRWATAPTFPNGANSLLIGTVDHGFMAFDYLIDLPLVGTMPDKSWSVLVQVATGPEAYLLAELALRAGRYDHAMSAYRRAADAGYPPAEAVLADMGLPFKPLPESLERARRHLDMTRSEFGPDHESSMLAEQAVMVIVMSEGRYDDAHAMAEELAARSESVFGTDHRLVLAARFSVAYCTFKLGLVGEGLAMLDHAAEETARALGMLDTAATGRRIRIARLLAESGQTDMARERLARVQKECDGFPSEHFTAMSLKQAIQQIQGGDMPSGGLSG